MSLISQAISHMFNGVSQQAPVLRSPSQGSEQINGLSSPVKGLKKRPSAQFIATMGSHSGADKGLYHLVDRDESTRYQVSVQPGGELKVFDLLTGSERDVTIEDGEGYLVSRVPSQELRMMTVEDYTFVLNREVVPTMRPWRYTNGQAFKATVTVNTSKEWLFGVVLQKYQGHGYNRKTSGLDIFATSEYVVKYFNSVVELVSYLKDIYIPSLFTPGSWRFPTGTLGGFPYEETRSAVVKGSGGSGSVESPYGSAAPFIGSQDLPGSDPLSVNAFSSSTWSLLSTIGLSSDLSYNRLLGPVTLSKRTWLSYPDPNVYTTFDQALSVEEYGTSWAPFKVDARSWYCRPLDNTTTVSGGRDSAPLRFAEYPTEKGLEKLMSPANGLVLNGKVFMEPPGLVGSAVVEYYASAMGAAFPDLDISVTVDNKLILQTTGPSQQLDIREYRRGYATVAYDYTGDYAEKLFIHIKAGVAEQTYRVSINGKVASYTSPKSDQPAMYSPEHIADNLADQIALWAGYTVRTFGRLVEVTPPANGATFDFYDSWSSQAMVVMKNQVESESALPPRFIEGVPIKVGRGDAGYYVHYVAGGQSTQAKSAGSLGTQVNNEEYMASVLFGGQVLSTVGGWTAIEGTESGGWEETSWPYEDREIDRSTMPHVLIAKADGTFLFKSVAWARRSAGDANSAPVPSFIGKSIKDMFFHRNRLGFMTNESVAFSKNGSFFDFWPDTARQVLDSDPIDVTISHTKVSILHSAVVFNSSVVLFSEKTQFVVTGADVLSPRTVNVKPANEYESNPLIRPVNAGDTVFFVNERSGYSQVMEYMSLGQQGNVATDITGHVPTYVPRGVVGLAASSTESCVALNYDQSLWVYKYLWGGDNQKVQDSWSRWDFDGNVLFAGWVKSKLYVTLEKSGVLYLEAIDMQIDGVESFGHEVHLDHKFTVKATDLDYNVETQQFVIQVPYGDLSGLVVINGDGSELSHVVSGSRLLVEDAVGTLVVGKPFRFNYKFSPIYVRSQTGASAVDGILTLRTLAVSYTDTMSFKTKVTAKGRQPHGSTVSKLSPEDGVHRFAVGSDAKTVVIELEDDTYKPLALVSAYWEGVFQRRSRMF